MLPEPVELGDGEVAQGGDARPFGRRHANRGIGTDAEMYAPDSLEAYLDGEVVERDACILPLRIHPPLVHMHGEDTEAVRRSAIGRFPECRFLPSPA